MRRPLTSPTAFLRRLSVATIPSAVVAFAILIGPIEPYARSFRFWEILGDLVLTSLWLHWLAVPYAIWLWVWRRPVGLHGAAKRNAILLTLAIPAGFVLLEAVIAYMPPVNGLYLDTIQSKP